MEAVCQSVADVLLLPELCSDGPLPRLRVPQGAYPRWGHTYYAGPPLDGQTKRWIVVSHNQFNASTRVATCVRTTSNDYHHSDVTPHIQSGLALAVCIDVTTKAQAKFDLAPRNPIAQLQLGEMKKVAYGLVNHLLLFREAGLA